MSYNSSSHGILNDMKSVGGQDDIKCQLHQQIIGVDLVLSNVRDTESVVIAW